MQKLKKEFIEFFVRFFVSATLIFLIWIKIGVYYQNFILEISKPLLLWMGYTKVQISALRLGYAYLVNFNLVPFIALVISIKSNLKHKIKLLIFGLPIFLLIHIVNLIAHFPAFFYNSEIAIMVVYGLPIFNLGFPFVIWVIYFIQYYIFKT